MRKMTGEKFEQRNKHHSKKHLWGWIDTDTEDIFLITLGDLQFTQLIRIMSESLLNYSLDNELTGKRADLNPQANFLNNLKGSLKDFLNYFTIEECSF
jgi:hypothetical protein